MQLNSIVHKVFLALLFYNITESAADLTDDLETWLDMTIALTPGMVGVGGAILSAEGISPIVSGFSVIDCARDITSGTRIKADREEVTPLTTFLIASTSKLITWTALSMLLDAGLFDLDDDINNYLSFSVRNPRFPNQEVTFRHLYAHTSGIKDKFIYEYGSDCPSDPLNPYSEPLSQGVEENIDGFSNWGFSSPGWSYSYSNMATGLAAVLVEEISGVPFAEFTKTYIFDPIGMTSTQWTRPTDGTAASLYEIDDLTNNRLLRKLKQGLAFYKTREGGYCFVDWPSGQLWTTPSDFLLFAKVMLQKGDFGGSTTDGKECLYRPDTGNLVFEKSSPLTGDGDSGLGWFVGKPFYEDGAGHNGGEWGVTTDFYVNFEENVAIVWFANGYVENSGRLTKKFMEAAKEMGSTTIVNGNNDCVRIFSP